MILAHPSMVAIVSFWDAVMSVVGRTLVRPDVRLSTLACIHSTGYIQSQNVYLNKILTKKVSGYDEEVPQSHFE